MSQSSYEKVFLTKAQCRQLKMLVDNNEARLLEEMEKAGTTISPHIAELVEFGIQECRVLSELLTFR